MSPNQIIESLKKEFPGKAIFCLPEDSPTEIICETNPSSFHSEFSEAIAYIKKSSPHKHLVTSETYLVLDGQLTLFIDGSPKILNSGEEFEIQPNTIHWAEGDWVKIKAFSRPGWTPTDHIII